MDRLGTIKIPLAATAADVLTSDSVGLAAWLPPVTGLSKGEAAFVVAATNAPASVKAVADYVCDGTADEVQINAALALGLKVHLSQGTFTLAAAISYVSNNQMLTGSGWGTIITGPTSILYLILANNVNDGVLRDLQIQGQATQAAGDSTDARGLNILGTSQRFKCDRVYFSGTISTTGLTIQVDIDPACNGNEFIGCYSDRIIGRASDHGYGFLIENSDYNRIIGCYFNWLTTYGRHAVYLSVGSSHNIVANNIMVGGTNVQIQIYATTAQEVCEYNVIHDNILKDATFSNGNPVVTCGAIEIAENAMNNHVHHNRIISSGAYGIQMTANAESGQKHADNNTIEQNEIINSQFSGIHVFGASNSRVFSNVITSSGLATANTYAGIQLDTTGLASCDNNYICSNNIIGTNCRSAIILNGVGNHVLLNTLKPGGTATLEDFATGTISDFNDINGAGWLLKSQIAVAGGDTVSSTTSETNFATNFVFPAYSFAVGRSIHVKAWGSYGTHSSGTVTMNLRLKMGSTVLLNFAAITTLISIAARMWYIDADLIITSIGSSGTIECKGEARIPTANTDVGASFPAVGGTAPITVNMTTTQQLQISAQHGGNNANNTITMREFLVEALG